MSKIIVLEDDASTRALITGILTKQGHEVIGVDNGAEGLLTIMADPPDVVISDVQMPKLSGFEVLAQVRQNPDLAHVPVILLTSLTSTEHVHIGIAQGADDYITKPFAPADLLESVSERLKGRRHAPPPFASSRPFGSGPDFASTQPQGLELELMPLGSAPPAPPPAAVPTRPARKTTPTAARAPDAAAQFGMGRLPGEQPEQHSTELSSLHLDNAWAMHVCVLNDAAFKAALTPRDWRLLVRNLYSASGPGAALRTASYVDLAEDSLTAVFADISGQAGQAAPARERAARAVAAMAQGAQQCSRWVAMHFASFNLPAPRVHIGLHVDTAEVAKLPLPSGGQRDWVLGAAVDTASNLHRAQPALPGLVYATEAALAQARGAGGDAALFQSKPAALVTVAGQALRLHALTGLADALGGQTWA